MSHDKRATRIKLAGFAFEALHTFRPCDNPDHGPSCCYVTGPSEPFHYSGWSYYANKAIAQQFVRVLGEKQARLEEAI